jgi:hypothetical protein
LRRLYAVTWNHKTRPERKTLRYRVATEFAPPRYIFSQAFAGSGHGLELVGVDELEESGVLAMAQIFLV